MSTASAPVEIGSVVLTVRDLARVAGFYEDLLGLTRLASDGSEIRLGTEGRELITLRGDAAARQASRREAGLFHTAFLMPSRADLGAWLIRSAEAGVPLQGASDHQVSEAIYLADPEGNGIEVYADRPRVAWYNPDGSIKMATDGLDLNDVARAAKAPYRAAPAGLVVGHVHLQVGAVAPAEAFYRDVIGMAVTSHYPGAAFYGSGGYHHHIATNVWNSRNAGPRSLPATGLAEVRLLADAASYQAIVGRAGSDQIADPWGTPISLQQKAA